MRGTHVRKRTRRTGKTTHVHQADRPKVHQANCLKVHQADCPKVHQADRPKVHQADRLKVHQADRPKATRQQNCCAVEEAWCTLGRSAWCTLGRSAWRKARALPFPFSMLPSAALTIVKFPSGLLQNHDIFCNISPKQQMQWEQHHAEVVAHCHLQPAAPTGRPSFVLL